MTLGLVLLAIGMFFSFLTGTKVTKPWPKAIAWGLFALCLGSMWVLFALSLGMLLMGTPISGLVPR